MEIAKEDTFSCLAFFSCYCRQMKWWMLTFCGKSRWFNFGCLLWCHWVCFMKIHGHLSHPWLSTFYLFLTRYPFSSIFEIISPRKLSCKFFNYFLCSHPFSNCTVWLLINYVVADVTVLCVLLVRPKTIVFGRTSVLRMMFFFRAWDLRDAWADQLEILHDG